MTSPVFPLPSAFVTRMKTQLGTQAEAYFTALEQPYIRGLRLNPRKPISKDVSKDILSSIPWESNGYYLSKESRLGTHPLHDAGAYYLQEPSAMIPAHILAPKPGQRVLDLCSAPGGKATQLADNLQGEGLLVCNEPVPSRAQILSRNLERMGVTCGLVVSADPGKLAERWPCAFDAILVDAPCSGEGMFRRHPETRLEWQENTPSGCATRQKRILESAFTMLKPGGRLVYSTCTLSEEENEEIIQAFIEKHPSLIRQDFAVPIGDHEILFSHKGMLRIYPHQIQGEGHFVALLYKEESAEKQTETCFLLPSQRLSAPTVSALEAYKTFCCKRSLPLPNVMLGDTLLNAPELPPLAGIKVLRAGLQLGIIKGKVFVPDHALSMTGDAAISFPRVPLTLSQARTYQSGESLFLEDAPRGYGLVTLEGLPLGFVKTTEGQMKNHYPKGLRRP